MEIAKIQKNKIIERNRIVAETLPDHLKKAGWVEVTIEQPAPAAPFEKVTGRKETYKDGVIAITNEVEKTPVADYRAAVKKQVQAAFMADVKFTDDEFMRYQKLKALAVLTDADETRWQKVLVYYAEATAGKKAAYMALAGANHEAAAAVVYSSAHTIAPSDI